MGKCIQRNADVYKFVIQKMKVQEGSRGTIPQTKSLVNLNLMKNSKPQSSYVFRRLSIIT